jgi:hypothetical protein
MWTRFCRENSAAIRQTRRIAGSSAIGATLAGRRARIERRCDRRWEADARSRLTWDSRRLHAFGLATHTQSALQCASRSEADNLATDMTATRWQTQRARRQRVHPTTRCLPPSSTTNVLCVHRRTSGGIQNRLAPRMAWTIGRAACELTRLVPPTSVKAPLVGTDSAGTFSATTRNDGPRRRVRFTRCDVIGSQTRTERIWEKSPGLSEGRKAYDAARAI